MEKLTFPHHLPIRNSEQNPDFPIAQAMNTPQEVIQIRPIENADPHGYNTLLVFPTKEALETYQVVRLSPEIKQAMSDMKVTREKLKAAARKALEDIS